VSIVYSCNVSFADRCNVSIADSGNGPLLTVVMCLFVKVEIVDY
jgi:hypothetical protein